MHIRAGLRTEIIVNIMFLMAAALLFAGVLFVRLTEKELLDQRLIGITAVMNTLSRSLALEQDQNGVLPLFQGLPPGYTVDGWVWTNRELVPRASEEVSPGFRAEPKPLTQVRLTGEPVVRLHYPSMLPWSGDSTDSYVVLTVPIGRPGQFEGALQARFSLQDVRARVQATYKMMALYVALYGAVLVLFGLYFLHRTVVRPIQTLQARSRHIAAGDLEPAPAIGGPKEVAELGDTLNAMAAALKQSRQETRAHIDALQQANAEVRQAQAELIRSEKMASVGHLAAGMAHEVGNPLGALIGYLDYLKGEMSAGTQRDIVDRSLAEASRIDRLVRELLDYATPSLSEGQVFEPVAALREAAELLRSQGVFEPLRLRDRLPASLPAVHMVRHQLVQVFINLLLNARDASDEGDAIVLAGGEDDRGSWLSVQDEGCGMSDEVLSHIFDPFFTTKAPDQGRGLGLAVCQRLVEDAGGRIEVQSRPGQGSEFMVRLPQVKEQA